MSSILSRIVYLLKVLEDTNATLYIAISYMITSVILTGRKYLFNNIVQSNYCIIEVFDRSKDGYKFVKIIKENLWEFLQACKYLHQILLIVKKHEIVNQRKFWMIWKILLAACRRFPMVRISDNGPAGNKARRLSWSSSSSSFDSVHLIPL